MEHRELSLCAVLGFEGWDGGEVAGRHKREGPVYVPTADSLHCAAETNIRL